MKSMLCSTSQFIKIFNKCYRNGENYHDSSLNRDTRKTMEIVTEIDNNRPFYSIIFDPQHYRVCQGYLIQNGYFYMYINDPMPVESNGTPKIELSTSQEKKRIYVRRNKSECSINL